MLENPIIMADINTNIIKEIIKNHIRERLLKRPNKAIKPKKRARMPRYPGNIERKYLKDVKGWLKPLLAPVRTITEEELRADSIAEDVEDRLFEIFDTIFEGEGKELLIASLVTIGAGVALFNLGEWISQIKWAVGDNKIPNNILLEEDWVADVVEKWANRNYRLIKNASADHIKNINEIIAKGVKEGLSQKEILKRVSAKNKSFPQSRLKLIVRDQVGKLNSALTERRNLEAGITTYEWLTSQDERVVGTPGGLYPTPTALHRNHFKMNGNYADWNDKSIYSSDKGETWKSRESELPQEHVGIEIQCFSDDVVVRSPIPANKLYRRSYSGKLITFTVSTGYMFSCTFNHPILGANGVMKAADLFDVHDDILSTSNNIRLPSFKSDQDYRIPTFKELFDFLSIVSPISTFSGKRSNFHGDGIIDQKIDIINIKGKLPNSVKIIFDKQIIEEFFTIANSRLSFISADGMISSCLKALGFTSDSFIRFFSYLFSIGFCGVCKSVDIRSRAISNINSIFSEDSSYNVARDIIFDGQSQLTGSGVLFNNLFFRKLLFIGRNYFVSQNRKIEPDEMISNCGSADPGIFSNSVYGLPRDMQPIKIVDKVVSEFETHVYNLQNDYGWYTVTESGLIVKNCRCVSIAIFDDMFEDIEDDVRSELGL